MNIQILLEESVTYLGTYTFYDDLDLIAVYYYGSQNPTHSVLVFSHSSVKFVYVSPDYADDNFCDLPIAPFLDANITYKIELEELTIMGNGTMHDYTPNNNNTAPWYENSSIIKSVNIEEGIKTIGSYSFYKFTNFEIIDIPKSVISIRPCAFSNCTKLKSFTIPETVTTIERGTFVGCYNLISTSMKNF